MRRRGSQDPQHHSKMTSRACFFPQISYLDSVLFASSSQVISLVFISHRPNLAQKSATTMRQLRPSSGLHPTAYRAACQKKCGRSVLLVTCKTTSQKNGAGSFHGDSACKHFSHSASFRASVQKLAAMISAVNSICLCFCFCVVFCCCCFCSAGRVHGGNPCSYFANAHTGSACCVGVRR